jgi:sortase B
MICSFYLVDYAVKSYKSTKGNNEALKDFSKVANSDGNLVDKYAAVREEYPDVVGRIIFDNNSKQMEYLVMQTGIENKDKYLHADPWGKYSERGNPYLDYECSIRDSSKISDNFLIYGHNMKDNTQFGSLDNNYKKKSYWEEHPTLKFETMYDDMATYEIFAAFYSKVYRVRDNVFKYYKFKDANNEEEFNDYINGVKKLCLYDTGITPQYGEQLITLSTCSYHVDNGRFVVVARRKDGRSPKDHPVDGEGIDAGELEELIVEETPEPTRTPTKKPTKKPTATPTPEPTEEPTPTPEPTEPSYEYMTMTPTYEPAPVPDPEPYPYPEEDGGMYP